MIIGEKRVGEWQETCSNGDNYRRVGVLSDKGQENYAVLRQIIAMYAKKRKNDRKDW